MNGVDAVRAIRKHENDYGRRNARIVGVTGNALSDDVEEFIGAGCNKVIMFVVLLARIIVTFRSFQSR
jgi:hypothetical protein